MMVLPSCGGVSGIASSKDAAVDSTSEKDVAEAEATDRCVQSCPTSEPAVGDSCAFSLWCEYGGSPLVSCNRVYDCFSAHVALDPSLGRDASACPAGLPPGCPASRTMVASGDSCGPIPLQCVYADSECDCILGNGTPARWVCSGVDAGSSGGCPVPRARLGTPCLTASTNQLCQYIAPGASESCSPCGNQWSIEFVPHGVLPTSGEGGD